MNILCRRCDVYVGFGGAGVVRPPAGRPIAWLSSHCWVCGRSAEEVSKAQRARCAVPLDGDWRECGEPLPCPRHDAAQPVLVGV